MKKFQLIHKEKRFHTKRMDIMHVIYKAEDGEELNHTIIESNPSVAVIVLNENREVALIRQFRTTTGEWHWEIPAGVSLDNEDILKTAKREAEEETGIVAKDVKLLTKCRNLLDPSKSNEDYGVAVANLDSLTARHLDDQEAIDASVVWMHIDEVYTRLRRQMATGEAFKDGIEMSGHSMYALLAYYFLNGSVK